VRLDEGDRAEDSLIRDHRRLQAAGEGLDEVPARLGDCAGAPLRVPGGEERRTTFRQYVVRHRGDAIPQIQLRQCAPLPRFRFHEEHGIAETAVASMECGWRVGMIAPPYEIHGSLAAVRKRRPGSAPKAICIA
jgi:hypothetical protein